jgi:hypothetical protein
MQLQELTIIQHHSVPPEDAWIIREQEAPQVPPDLRGSLTVPCILTGDAEQARNLLSFMQAVAATL